MKRQRGRNRNNRNNNHNNQNRSMDSNGPEVKVRGTASTIYEKYTTLARDAQSSGNRVKAENLRQHAEHYLRLLNIQEAAKRAAQEERDAARAAREDANETSDNPEDKKHRRHQPRRNNRDNSETVEACENSGEDKTPSVETAPDRTDEKAETLAVNGDNSAPKRRRKAPARSTAPEKTEAVDAAE